MRSLLLWCALPLGAAAQPMDLYGFGPRSMAMGGVQAAADGDYSAAYYNPALLSKGSVGVGFNYGVPSMYINADAPLPALSSQTPVDYAGITVGAASPLFRLLNAKITL